MSSLYPVLVIVTRAVVVAVGVGGGVADRPALPASVYQQIL